MDLATLKDYMLLPPEISDFERQHLGRINKIALYALALHIPIFVAIAWFNNMGPTFTLGIATLAILGPLFAAKTLHNPRHLSTSIGVALMAQGGLLVHIGQGPIQIEMHFYFFAVLALLSTFGNPMVIIAAAATVAVHHAAFWLFLPASVFNYDAPFWVVGVHALFLVIEAVGACYIARNYFDNVIGLEKIVNARTEELDARNVQLQLIFDNIHQGLCIVHRDATVSSERSSIFSTWFGAATGDTLFDLFPQASPAFISRLRMGWDELNDGFMPLELTLEQLPKRLQIGELFYELEFEPIGGADGEPEQFLLKVNDVTALYKQQQAEMEREETMQMIDRIFMDRRAFVEFFEDAQILMTLICAEEPADMVVFKRALHTLKGNAGLFGLSSIAAQCHELESWMEREASFPPAIELQALHARWTRLGEQLEQILGANRQAIELSPTEHARIERAFLSGHAKEELFSMIHGLKLEPIERRFDLFSQQLEQLATRLEKPAPQVSIDANNLRVDGKRWSSFWSAFAHALRNAIDHGVEAPEQRLDKGKAPEGHISLKARIDHKAQRFIIELIDDGQGINMDALTKKAKALGLPHANEEDLTRALFADGVSTAEQTTDISGRGVGMGALLATTEALSGKITLETKRHSGTTWRFSFPVEQMDPEYFNELQARLAA